MRSHHVRKFDRSCRTALATTAVVGFAFTVPAEAQPYYYQPAPDYYHNDTASGTFLGGASAPSPARPLLVARIAAQAL